MDINTLNKEMLITSSYKRTHKFSMISQVYTLISINMATVLNFEVMSGKLKIFQHL